jgi:hypothetical protein
MDSGALLRIVLAFAVAGTWISLSTIAGERLGTRLGGLIANLPSNILVSLLFIAMTKGDSYAAQAALSVPVGMTVDTLFLLALVAALGRGLLAGLAAGLGAWIAAALIFLALPPLGAVWGIALYAIVCAGSFLAADRIPGARSVPKKAVPFRPSSVLVRALFAGTIVALAVAIAQVAPPYMTGVLAVFPAVLLSTMTILARAQGLPFARATGKVLILSSSNIIVYALAVALLFPILGPWWGTLGAFAAAALYVALLAPVVRKVK